MLTKIDTEKAISNYLNEYLFDHVWNLPQAEYRQNIIMRCIASTPKVSRIHLGVTSVYLPDTKPYLVYAVPKTYLEGIKVDVPEWTNLLSYINERPIDFRITGTNGEWLYRDMIFIMNHPCEDSFLVAINYHMAVKILNSDSSKRYNFKKMYFSVYYDSNRGKTVYYDCMRPLNLSQRNIAWDRCQLALEDNKGIIIINGREAVPTSILDIQSGDFIEFIDDPDIVANFTIDLTRPDQNRFFKSSLIPEFKYIVHIPKEYNPRNYLITHNTCDVFIRPKNIANAHLKGVFIHRFNTKDTITQITHNDFAIAESLIQRYMEFVGSTEVELKVVARCHVERVKTIDVGDIGSKIYEYDYLNGESIVVLTSANIHKYLGTTQVIDNRARNLIREANYIDMLYQLSDEEILDMLEGNGPKNLSFWKAEHLEASQYIKMMFKNPEYIDESNMASCTTLLSYYNTMSVLCGRITRTTLSVNNTHTFSVLIPVVLMKAKKIFANVFINGIKLDYSKYTIGRFAQFLEISVVESVDLPAGVEIVTELFEQPECHGEFFIPSIDNNRSFRVSEEFMVFRVHELGAVGSVLRNDNYYTKQYSLDQSYENVTGDDNVYTTNGTNIYFSNSEDNKTFFICSKNIFVNPFNLKFNTDDLDGKSITSGVLMQDYKAWHSDEVVTRPVVQDVYPIVFLNGKELVKDVDFSFNDNKDLNGYTTCKTVHIANVEYFTELKRSIANFIIVTQCGSANIKGQYKLINNTLTGTSRIWTNESTGISIFYIDGRWVIGTISDTNNKFFYESEPTESLDPTKNCVWTVGDLGKPVVPYLSVYYDTYTKRDDNYAEILLTSDDCFASENGFIIDSACNSLNILMYWYPGLAMFTADGKAVKDIVFRNGYLHLDPSEVREGAIYNMRAMAPNQVVSILDKYIDSTQDLDRCANIIAFFRSRLVEDNNYTVIPNSHHIYSIIMNEITNDVLDGRLKITYDADIEKMLLQVEDYLTIRDQDPALNGQLGTITVSGGENSLVNAVYKILDENATGKIRIWTSSNSVVVIKWVDGRWVIRSIYKNIVEPYYYALDPNGDRDPWTLTWLSDNNDKAPTLHSGNLNLKFIDIRPSYRVDAISDPVTYLLLKHLAKVLLPADGVRDVINAQN